MGKPCETCVVGPCCSEACVDLAIYVYDEELCTMDDQIVSHIEKMPYDDAIEFIVKVESAYRSVDK